MRKCVGLTAVGLACLLMGVWTAHAQGAFQALNGATAENFTLPADVTLVSSMSLTPYGLTYERYQQVVGNASVLGGQLTVLSDATGKTVAVIGAHYPGIQPSNRVNVTAAQARQKAAQDVGSGNARSVNLRLNPEDGRYFYQVETEVPGSRWIHWIDAGNSAVFNKFDALTNGWGYGGHHSTTYPDVKDLTGLTTFLSGSYSLISQDGRQETHDQGSTNKPFLGPVARDANDAWDILGRVSPAQQALVDAHYYAALTDDYLAAVHGFDWVSQAGAANGLANMVVHAHFTRDYANAYWNGSYIAIGDGDGVSYGNFGTLDVIAHELTHGVTEFTSNLVYQNESGALNESFSDMIGTSLEYFAEANGREPSVLLEPDFLIGEDLDLRGGGNPGFRSMADPTEDGDPSHYADRYTGTQDNGGVHSNSGISNHWFYLLVNGGQNARADRASGTDVQGIGLSNAERIAFLGFVSLTETANFCDARTATLAVAGADETSVMDAWDEVGISEGLCSGVTPNTPPTANFSSTATGLSVDFADTSTDTDGTVVAWDWNFGDNTTSTAQNPSHTYAAGGTYGVTLTVTDNSGDTHSVTRNVTVVDGSSSGITLTVRAYKVKGIMRTDLTWSGATTANVEVHRGGQLIATTGNDGAYTDNIGLKGSGTFTYQVCETGGGACSNTANAVF